MPADDLSPDSIRREFAPKLDPVPPVTPPADRPPLTMGEALILLAACGYRLDEAMGVAEYRRIQTRLIVGGLLKDDGEPTALGDATAKAHLEKRKLLAASAALQPKPNGN